MPFRKVLSQPCLVSVYKDLPSPGLKKSKSDSNLQSHINRTVKKTIISCLKKFRKDGKAMVEGFQDVQFANEVCNSSDAMQSIFLSILMVYSIEREEDRMKRVKLICGALVLLEIVKHLSIL
jgi:hypothetical protein